MAFSVFNMFILALKRAFHKIAQYLLPKKVPAETPTSVPQEEKPSEGYTKEETREESRPEVMEEPKDVESKKDMEGEKVTQVLRKPYKRKSPITGRKEESRKLSTARRKTSGLERRKIDLGDLPQKPKPLRRLPQVPEGEIGNRITPKTSEEKEVATSIESPFVEIDLDEGKVFLILPEQQFKVDRTDQIPQQLSYGVQLDGDSQEVVVSTTGNNDSFVLLQEERICLETPLKNFQVHFPDELQGRIYSYRHTDENLYVFVAIGRNRGRMHYLYNKDGNINPIPKRVIWMLLGEELELQTDLGSGDIIGEKWIWEHKPFRIDLLEKDELIVTNKTTGKAIRCTCEATFSIEGEEVIKDDFRRECPLFTDKSLKIRAPYENSSGWVVWIRNEAAGHKKVSENWTGVQPLNLSLPANLPCGCGEFQVHICQQDRRIPDETLFFRWLPFVELDYTKELVIPDSHHGHKPEIIKVNLSSVQEWALRSKAKLKVESTEGGFYQVELPPEKDDFRFSIVKKGKPETEIGFQITVPRLKWKTSKQQTWEGKTQKIRKKELLYGEDFYLFICTNDFNAVYDLWAILRTNSGELQEAKLHRIGTIYSVKMNQFYDTISENEGETTLAIQLRKTKSDQLLSQVDVLTFGPLRYRCKVGQCDFTSETEKDLITHVERHHLDDLSRELSYAEIREKYDISLPRSIYKCSFCSYYAPSDDWLHNPTSSICSHIQDVHKGSTIRFRVVHDAREIRRYVIQDLPSVYECNLCGQHFKNISKQIRTDHLIKHHKNELYDYE